MTDPPREAGQVLRDLGGLRILLVEDEGAISLLLESLLEALGCDVVGIASSLKEALPLAEEAGIDVALLDVNVAGEAVYPVAERLIARNIPFIFSTGYGVSGLDARWRASPVLVKPFTASQLEAALQKACLPRDPLGDPLSRSV